MKNTNYETPLSMTAEEWQALQKEKALSNEMDEWSQAAYEHLSNIATLFIMAGEELDIAEMCLAMDAREMHRVLLRQALDRVPQGTPEEHALLMLTEYFIKQWGQMGDKTKVAVLMELGPIMNELGQACLVRKLTAAEPETHGLELF